MHVCTSDNLFPWQKTLHQVWILLLLKGTLYVCTKETIYVCGSFFVSFVETIFEMEHL